MLNNDTENRDIDAIAHHISRISTSLGAAALVALPVFLALKFAGVLA